MKSAFNQDFGTPSADVVARAKVREAMICHVNKVAWTHVATLTHRRQSAEGVWAEFRRMIRRLERKSQGRVTWIAVMEHVFEQHYHLHVLLQLRGDHTLEALRECWEAGNVHLERFDPGRSAVAYITKEAKWHDLEYQVSWQWGDVARKRPVSRRRRPRRCVSPTGPDLGAHRPPEAG